MESLNKVDVHVGHRIRSRRKEIGMSQTDLANHLSLTFQQVQKYERGFNRISASKMHDAARALGVHIEYFFEGLDNETELDRSESEASVTQFLLTREGAELSSHFSKLSANQRKGVLALVRMLVLD